MKKRFLSAILSICMVFVLFSTFSLPVLAQNELVWDGTASTDFAGGSGTKDDPYQISNAKELKLLSDNVASGNRYYQTYFKLTADVVLNEGDISTWDGEENKGWIQWNKIGNYQNPFGGIFDGDGHSVSGLYINNSSYYEGLFGYVSIGTITNVGVINSYISTDRSCGGIVGYAGRYSNITNCYNTSKIIATSIYAGGIVGENKGSIRDCFNSGDVSSFGMDSSQKNRLGTAGGIAGYNDSNIENCYNTGNISVKYSVGYVGGIVGTHVYHINTSIVKNCYNIGEISATKGSYSGGIVGNSELVTIIENSYSLSPYKIVGRFFASIINCSTFDDNRGIFNDLVEIKGVKYTNLLEALNANANNIKNNYETWVTSSGENNDYPVFLNEFQGRGTSTEPYLISNLTQFKYFADKVNSGDKTLSKRCYKLTSDIVLNEGDLNNWDGVYNSNINWSMWKPIGDNINQFSGTFDGDGFTVSGIYINDNTLNYQGLFGYLSSSGIVKNVVISNSYINGYTYIGSVVGYNDGLVENCNNSAQLYSQRNGGGIVGYNSGTVQTCYNSGKVSGISDNSYIGGLIGNNKKGTVLNCYNLGEISVNGINAYSGGIIGNNWGTIKNCYNLGNVSNSGIGSFSGGIVGNNNDMVQECYSLVSTAPNNKIIGTSTSNGKSANCTTFTDKGTLSNKVNINGNECNDLFTALDKNSSYIWQRFDFVNSGHPIHKIKKLIGKGTEKNPFLIRTEYDFAYFSSIMDISSYSNAHYKLTTDIVLNEGDLSNWDGTDDSNKNWAPFTSIGNAQHKFNGIFDGGGHTISGIYINSSNTGEGLFAYTTNSVIKNVGVINSYIKGKDFVGGIVGNNEYGYVQNCYYTGKIVSERYSGGITGTNEYGYIQNCYNTGESVLGWFSGGITETNEHGEVQNCYNTSKIVSVRYSGGIAGANISGSVKNSYNTGEIVANECSGGIAGGNEAGIIQNSFNTGGIVTYKNAGGIVANSFSGTVVNCYNTGNVSCKTNDQYNAVGGLVGINYLSYLKNSYSLFSTLPDGEIIGTTEIPLYGTGTIENCATFNNSNGVLTLFEGGTLMANTLFEALNKWVDDKNDTTLKTWLPDSDNQTNNGYPVFGKAISVIELQNKIALYNGNVINIDKAIVKGSSGMVNYLYYTDSSCTYLTTDSDGAEFTGGAPKNTGTYYVKATVEEDDNFLGKSVVATLMIVNERHITVIDPTVGGKITIDQNTSYLGNKITVTATPDEGYYLLSVIVNGETIDGLEFLMPDHDVTVTANFEKIPVEDNEDNSNSNETNKPPVDDTENDSNSTDPEEIPTDNIDNPDTCDNSNITLWIIMMFFSFSAILTLYKIRIKSTN